MTSTKMVNESQKYKHLEKKVINLFEVKRAALQVTDYSEVDKEMKALEKLIAAYTEKNSIFVSTE